MLTDSSRRTALTALVAMGAVGAAAATWGIGVERHLYTVRRHTVPVLPAGSDSLRVLHVSDAHLAPWQHHRAGWIAGLASLNPDLVVSTGDSLGHQDGLTRVRDAFAPFAGVPGLFVHGSNDLFAPAPRNPVRYFTGPSKKPKDAAPLDTAALDAFFTHDLGWTSVDNAAASLTVQGLRVAAFGVGDAHHGLDRLDLVPELAASVRSDSPALTLGIGHAPYRRVLDSLTAAGADMLFAGHTHGGQVRLPWTALVANCDLPLSQTRGLSRWSASGRTIPLNVSAGLGHSIYAPVRFFCRPEASLLTLIPAPDSSSGPSLG